MSSFEDLVVKKLENKISIFLAIMLIALIFPYANTIFYALPSTDDFWMVIGVEKSTLFQDAVETACSFWMGWGGMWIYEFLRVLLNPIVLFGATSKLVGVELLIFFLLFLCAVWILINAFWKKIIKEDKLVYRLGSYILILLWFLNAEVWTEVFYWFAGSAYMWAMSLVCVTVALEFSYFEKPDKKNAIALSIVGAVTCSFYSQAVFPCAIFLALMGREVWHTRKIQWSKFIPFVCFLMGALSALIAPGNFQRKEVDNGVQMRIISTFKDTFVMWARSILDLIQNPMTIIIMLAFVLLGLCIMKESRCKYRYPLAPFMFTFACLYVTYFPFALGYGGSSYLPNRAKFIFDMFAVLLFSVSCMYLGAYLRYQKKIELKYINRVCCVTILVMFAYACLVPSEYYRKLPYIATIEETEAVKSANMRWTYLIKQIEISNEKEVYQESPIIYTPIIKEPGITSDDNSINNKKISDYYEKDAIGIFWW